ncbi:hypothetical protein AB834_05535 [PVC group bacterium (ex Bugula neritina AB1)]|nr:hypothetical protein AB834_05535 [PVC group bacterium (ex Bugula neritina AB1)]
MKKHILSIFSILMIQLFMSVLLTDVSISLSPPSILEKEKIPPLEKTASPMTIVSEVSEPTLVSLKDTVKKVLLNKTFFSISVGLFFLSILFASLMIFQIIPSKTIILANASLPIFLLVFGLTGNALIVTLFLINKNYFLNKVHKDTRLVKDIFVIFIVFTITFAMGLIFSILYSALNTSLPFSNLVIISFFLSFLIFLIPLALIGFKYSSENSTPDTVKIEEVTPLKVKDSKKKSTVVSPHLKEGSKIVELIEGQAVFHTKYATSSNYYSTATIKANPDAVFIFGANESHILDRKGGGAGQAAHTAGHKNVFPILTLKLDREGINDLNIKTHQISTKVILKKFVKSGGTVVLPIKVANDDDVNLLKEEGYNKDINKGDLIVNVGTGIASQLSGYIKGSRRYAQDLYDELREIVTQGSINEDPSFMQVYQRRMSQLESIAKAKKLEKEA